MPKNLCICSLFIHKCQAHDLKNILSKFQFTLTLITHRSELWKLSCENQMYAHVYWDQKWYSFFVSSLIRNVPCNTWDIWDIPPFTIEKFTYSISHYVNTFHTKQSYFVSFYKTFIVEKIGKKISFWWETPCITNWVCNIK